MNLVEHQLSGITEAITAWQPSWRWGVQALDAFGDGRMAIVITDHNGISKVLRQVSPLKFEGGGEVPCGTFRPTVCDFDNSGSPDLLFRSDLASTAFKNNNGTFVPVPFKYATGNPPIREIGYTGEGTFYFGHDFGRWLWAGNGFSSISYSHPTPPCISAFLNQAWQNSKPNIPLRVWYDDFPRVTLCSGFTAYGGQRFIRAVRRDSEVTQQIGLPLEGPACWAGQLTGDRQPEILATGYGYYKSNPQGKYDLVPGALTECLKIVGPYIHQVRLMKKGGQLLGLVVNNPRGQRTDIFKYVDGTFHSVNTIGSWDGEPFTVCELLGDGEPYVLVGSVDKVRAFSFSA